VPRAAFLEVGGFATDIPRAYDVELAYRLDRHGLRFEYLPDALAREVWRGDFAFAAGHFERAGRDAFALYRRHRSLLDHVELGMPWEPGPRGLAAFRLLASRAMPLRALRLVDRVVPNRVQPRWHRLLARACYWRGVRKSRPGAEAWRALTGGTPILMYHAIGRDGERASRYVVPAKRFAAQMGWLSRRGYTVVGLGAYARLRAAHELVPGRTLVLTFDDGYADNAELAAPVLERLGFSATVFVVSARVGGEHDWADERHAGTELAGRPLASWDQLARLRDAGIEIGAHTRTHPSLCDVDAERAADEIAGSRRDLEQRLGTPVTTFAYPYGEHDDEVVTMVESAGFAAACTVRPGLNRARTPLLRLRRAEVRGSESLVRFALAVRLGDPEAFVSRKRR
jgi:peptidoglycan/xylan/chitin deacetylase (PgdA/CDA1 family)